MFYRCSALILHCKNNHHPRDQLSLWKIWSEREDSNLRPLHPQGWGTTGKQPLTDMSCITKALFSAVSISSFAE